MLAATARAEDHHFWFIGLRRFAKQVLDGAAPAGGAGVVIDCGAGTGRNLDWLEAYGAAVGVELSPAGLAVARAAGRRMVRGSVAALPFADGAAGLVTSFDVLYCLDDDVERQALREMHRVLRPGGLALVNAAALDILHGSHSALTREQRRYTPARLRRRLEAAGFRVERLTFTNMTTFPVTLAVRGFDRLAGRAGTASEADLRVPVRPVNAAFNVALAGEAMLLRAVDLPIGTSLLCLARRP